MISAPDRRERVELVEEAYRSGARRERACQELGICLRTYQRWREDGEEIKSDGRAQAQRPAPANRLSEEERQAVLEVCNQPAYRSQPPSQIVPALADEGRYLASESTFYRLLRQADQLHHRGKARAPRQVVRPKGYVARGPKQVWSWDITYLATTIAGIFFRLYLVMDIYSRKIVGWEVYARESAELAAVVMRKACLAEGITESGLVLHSDNGAPMKGATMLATLQRLGVVPSFSRPSVSDDNPYSESLFRTMKYTPAYPSRPFETLDQAREWVYAFVHWYNHEHRHSAIRFVTPAQRHRGEEEAILAAREATYAGAKAAHPERWAGKTRDWSRVREVWLNPEKPRTSEGVSLKKAA